MKDLTPDLCDPGLVTPDLWVANVTSGVSQNFASPSG